MPAFSQPVFDMQRVFRVVLDAMSRPARLCRLPVFPQSVPDGLSPVLAALALTLCDNVAPFPLRLSDRRRGGQGGLRAGGGRFRTAAPVRFRAGRSRLPRPFRNRLACRSGL